MLIRAIALVIAAGLLSSFAFILGPRLRKEQQHEFYACLTLAGIAFGVLILHFLSTGWLADAGNATTVQAVAAAAQAAFTVAVIVLTVQTVRANRDIANKTADMSASTERMAVAALDQQRAATRPVLVFRLQPCERQAFPDVHQFVIEALNVGAGPALEMFLSVDGPPLRYDYLMSRPQPVAIAQSELTRFEFVLDVDRPFSDDSEPMRWMPDPTLERQIVAAWAQATSIGTMTYDEGVEAQEKYDALQEKQRRAQSTFHQNVADRVSGMTGVGVVRADYRDLAGAHHRSSASLLVQERIEDSSIPYNWSPLTLGRLTINILSGDPEGAV
jgi:hypothetical protein